MKNRIKELRKNEKLSLTEMSEKIGIGRGTINNYENGKTDPKLKTWRKLADFFGVSVAFIQGENTFQDIKDFSYPLMVECIFNKQLYTPKDKDAFYKLHSCLKKFAEMNKINYQETFTDNGMIRGDAVNIAEALFKEVFSDAFFERIRMSKMPTSPSYELANNLVQQFMNYFNSDNNLIDNDLIYIQGMLGSVKVMDDFIRKIENLQELVKLRKNDKKNLDEKLNLVKSSFDDYSSNLKKIRNSMVHGTYNDKE